MFHKLLRPKFKDARSETIWLTVYADLMTNLALVFLALYGLTLMGDDALSKAIQSMKIEDMYEFQYNPNDKFEDLAPSLRQKIMENRDVIIREEVGAVRIEFGERVLFGSGNAILKSGAHEALAPIIETLKSVPYTLVVEGHTDSLPLQPGVKYLDNWELSLARAMSVVDVLTARGIPASHVAAAAYGPNRPRASNETVSGRRMNRRVEIALFKEFSHGS